MQFCLVESHVYDGWGHVPSQPGDKTMSKKVIDVILAKLHAVSRSPNLQPEQRDEVMQSIKEFRQVRRSGKLDQGKLYRATARVAEVLLQSRGPSAGSEDSTTDVE